MHPFSITALISFSALLALSEASGPTWTVTHCSPTPTPTVDPNSKGYLAVKYEGKRHGCLNERGRWTSDDSKCVVYQGQGSDISDGITLNPVTDEELSCTTIGGSFDCNYHGFATGFAIDGSTLSNSHVTSNHTEICLDKYWASAAPDSGNDTEILVYKKYADNPDTALTVSIHWVKTLKETMKKTMKKQRRNHA